LAQFVETGIIHFVKIDGTFMLTARDSAELLGISPESFLKIRKQAELRGIKELCGEEVVPGCLMWSRIALVRFSLGEFDLGWPEKDHAILPKALPKPNIGVE